jgi:hypothetical protein
MLWVMKESDHWAAEEGQVCDVVCLFSHGSRIGRCALDVLRASLASVRFTRGYALSVEAECLWHDVEGSVIPAPTSALSRHIAVARQPCRQFSYHLGPPCFMRFAQLVIRCEPDIAVTFVSATIMHGESCACIHECDHDLCVRFLPSFTYSRSVPRFVADNFNLGFFLVYVLMIPLCSLIMI